MKPTDSSERLRSLEMRELTELFQGTDYPATTEEICERFADVEIQYPSGAESLRDVLLTAGPETYQSADDLNLAVLNGVRRDAVGRPRYSDRALDRDNHDSPPESF